MKTIIIDPGHGGSDPGASYRGQREKDLNLAIALKVRDFLQKYHEVNLVLTRDKDTTMSLQQRSDFANAKKADFYLSIHINAGGGTGFESFIYYNGVPQSTVTQRQVIHDEVMLAVKGKYNLIDRGKKKANFHVLRETSMSAVLIEVLFIDHEKDYALLKNQAFINDFSIGLAKGVAKALSLPAKAVSSSLYKVIAGSFKDRKNAEERVGFLKSKGIEAFVVAFTVSGSQFYRAQAGSFASRENADKRIAALKTIGISDAFVVSDADPGKTAPQKPAEPSKPTEPTTPHEPPKPADPQPTDPVKPPEEQTPAPALKNPDAIKGNSALLPSQLDAFVKTVNPAAPELGQYYVKYGQLYGIKGDIAFAQAIHETNYFRFTGSVKKEQNNFAGLGATSATATGASFSSPDEGVHAHIQHLFAYASTENIPAGQPMVDPRFTYVARGSAQTWTMLNGKWAVPGTTYGQMILAIYKKMVQYTLAELAEQKVQLEQLLDKF